MVPRRKRDQGEEAGVLQRVGQQDVFDECLGGHAMALPGGKDAQHQSANLLSTLEGVWLYQAHRSQPAYGCF